jgi:hypothetical protein
VREAAGFRTADGAVSSRLEDLPESGDVQVVLLLAVPEPCFAEQVRPCLLAALHCKEGAADLSEALLPVLHQLPDLLPPPVCFVQLREMEQVVDVWTTWCNA